MGTLLDDTLLQQITSSAGQGFNTDGANVLSQKLTDAGVTSLSDLKWRDANALAQTDGISAADRKDAWGGTTNNVPGGNGLGTPGATGWSTPGGQVLNGDIGRSGDWVYSIGQDANGNPTFSQHQDTPDLGLKDLAMVVIGTIGAAYGMEGLGAGMEAMGAGAAAGAEGAGAAAAGGEAAGAVGGAAGGGIEGAAGGMLEAGGSEVAGEAGSSLLTEGAAEGAAEGVAAPETLLDGALPPEEWVPPEDWAPGETPPGDFGPEPEPYDENMLPDESGNPPGDYGPDPEPYDENNLPTEEDVPPVDDGATPPPEGDYGPEPAPYDENTLPTEEDVPVDPGDGGLPDPGGNGLPDLPFDWKDFLNAFLGGLKGLLGGGGDVQPVGPPMGGTPEQPVVGASGQFAQGTAQGGASGSLEGVAGTLLTSKDTFGYGKSTAG